jgi:hypothetical protein
LMHVEPEAEYTDAACVPYTASALAIGEESIYAACGVDRSRNGRGEAAAREAGGVWIFASPAPGEAARSGPVRAAVSAY